MIKKTILPNGLRIITEQMPESYSATIMVWIDAGPSIENTEQNGISHFTEHMLFKGTKTRTAKDIVQTIESYGGSINAFTDKEASCYYARVLDNQVNETIEILLDITFNSQFKPEDIELERQVILEEIKMYEDAPDELVHDLLIRSFWNEHPLGQPVAGTADTVSGISRDDILNYVHNYYNPDNIVISVAGKFDEEAVIEQISKITENNKAVTEIKEIKVPNITPQLDICHKDIEQAHVCIGTRGVSVLNDDRYILAIIDVCLGGCMASRLFQEVREKRGLVYSINTYEALYRPAGIFGVYFGTNPNNVQEVLDLTLSEIEKVKVEGLSNDEIEKAKSQLKGSLLVGLESTKYRATRNARSELYFGRMFSTEEICSAIDKVSSDGINKITSSIFDTRCMGISLVGPKESSFKELSLSCSRS